MRQHVTKVMVLTLLGAGSLCLAAEPGASTSTVALEPGSPQRTSGPAESLMRVLLAQSGPDKSGGAVEPAALFSKLGCALCHNPGARYHDKILRSVNRSPEELVRWIRNPEKFVPGTPMPTYASLIDEPTALALARWLKEAGPGAPTHK
jgi:mono/diheme cytochrome c family protein